jgi:hypothetical protein
LHSIKLLAPIDGRFWRQEAVSERDAFRHWKMIFRALRLLILKLRRALILACRALRLAANYAKDERHLGAIIPYSAGRVV